MRKMWLGYFSYPPETGAGSGSGSPENIASPGTDSSVSSGTASEALIAAAMASESSSGGTGTESEAERVAKATGLNIETGDTTGTGANKAGATGQQSTVETGQAPQNRIEAAVKNARAAATTEVEAKYAWAKNLDQNTVQTSFALTRELVSDPAKFLRTLAAQEGFQIVPIGGAKETVEAAAPKEFKLPEPQLHSEDGKGAYSSEQMSQILTDFAASLEAKFGNQLKPILGDREAAQKAAAREAVVNEARATVTETMTELRAKPFFQVTNTAGEKVDSPKIMEYLMAIPEKARLANPVAAIHRAYAMYMEKDILPNYGKISEQRVRDENAKKAAASGARPGAGGGQGDSTAKPLRGVNDLAKKMEEMYAAAGSGA